MQIVHYPAIIERAGDGFSVFFPDLPGLTSAGSTEDEALGNAEQALCSHLVVSAEYGDAIPEPSAMSDLTVDPDVVEVFRARIKAALPSKPKRINVTMDEALVSAIDRATDNRSRFLADAARDKLASV